MWVTSVVPPGVTLWHWLWCRSAWLRRELGNGRYVILTSCARGDTVSPAPLPPSRAAEQTQRSSTFPCRICWPLQPPYSLRPRWVKRPGAHDLWPFDLESGVRVTCDVGYLCANFGLPGPLCYRPRPDVRDKQTSDVRQKHRLMLPSLRGGGTITSNKCRPPGGLFQNGKSSQHISQRPKSNWLFVTVT